MQATMPIVPAFEISAATTGMSKGTRQSEGPQVVPKIMLKSKSLQLSGQWKNIDTNSAKGEATIAAGWSGKLGGFDTGTSIAYKFLASASGSGNRHSWEFGANAARKFGKAGARISAVYSPDDFGGTGRSLYVEGGPTYELPWKLRASANVGFRRRANNSDYTSFNAGLTRPIGKALSLDVRYYDTNRGELGENFDRRVVALVRFSM